MTDEPLTITKRTYTVQDIQTMLNIGRNSAYALVSDPPFPILRIGANIRIPMEGFDNWLMGA